MKKLIPILVLLISFSSFAQNGGKMQERIKAQKIAFITEKLSLTSEEAQQFWPIYNAYEAKVEDIRSKDLQPLKQEMRRGDISDKRAKELLEKLMKAETDMHEAKLQLVQDLKEVISSKKIILLKAAEDQFNKILLERLKQMRDKRNRKN
ncbi:sensor of ECF-type sigma factor [Winogradskyella ouciana]|uniref:Sensor of ECF-type sigma factor n=1 Tax=Winogradskyella ouciana TaxID=2608631 RepID=A0A7K1GHK7_9FLAO|nr:sensor of ECF-type sigma factor [Winogradskyella ouciana]MTE27469.1 sensor of ECF-type sigma factor [Winogradskyella ouciana]